MLLFWGFIILAIVALVKWLSGKSPGADDAAGVGHLPDTNAAMAAGAGPYGCRDASPVRARQAQQCRQHCSGYFGPQKDRAILSCIKKWREHCGEMGIESWEFEQ
ncbi:MAG: hypothetical protein V3W33_02190 [Gammaproteobacteria bacterium]